MKKLYLIGGTMGVGKTSVCQQMKKELPNAVFLDGDWCWDADPFQVTDETKQMVMNNICYMLNSFLHCSLYENVIFCWVMQEQSIIDEILARVDTSDCSVKVISLLATKDTLTERIMQDVNSGIRTIDVLARSVARIPLYEALNTRKINTDGKNIGKVAKEVTEQVTEQDTDKVTVVVVRN